MVHGDLPRQHSFGTALRFTGPVPAEAIFLGSGIGFGEFNYASEARESILNSVIETGVVKVAGWLVGWSVCSFVLM